MAHNQALELWGGIECTINRVGDHFFDQISRSGHEQRDDDVEYLAALGIKSIRYPVLWERYCRQSGDVPDCSDAKRRLDRLQELRVEPIVGLLHHGSGPMDTSLLDKDFPKKFADYALAIARQLPQVRHFTPINEPLTTARFSGLYGHWYPHHRDDGSFLSALVNQIEATRLSMQAIRSVNPDAKLVQTENLDQCHSTSCLRYQADFENHRRWLSIDLLTGKVDINHPLWNYIEQRIDDVDVIAHLHSYPVSIDILGWNYYLTSERFLDHRLERYPSNTYGNNGIDHYADIEAVRVLADGIQGIDGLFVQAWNRYRLPMAITEVHLGCHRESQLRWIMDAWQSANRLRKAGVDLRAMTVWNILGSYDWDSLCTLSRSHYESGAFDTRSGKLRSTLVASLLKNLSNSSVFDHPALPDQGWWELPSRFVYESGEIDDLNAEKCIDDSERCIDARTRTICDTNIHECELAATAERPPLLITGANGTLGKAFGEICRQRGIQYCLCTRNELDITDTASIESAIEQFQPWAIINTAGYVRVDAAEQHSSECFKANTDGARLLATASAKYCIPLVMYSSDLVFDGRQRQAYVEDDAPRALSAYGESKLIAERLVRNIAPQSLVIRTSSFFGLWDDYNFLTTSLQKLERGQKVFAVNDWIVSPTYVPDLVHRCIDLLIDGASGIWHLANEGQVTWHEFLSEAASNLGFDTRNVVGRPRSESRFVAQRPAFSALASRHGSMLPGLSESVGSYCSHWQFISSRSLQMA